MAGTSLALGALCMLSCTDPTFKSAEEDAAGPADAGNPTAQVQRDATIRDASASDASEQPEEQDADLSEVAPDATEPLDAASPSDAAEVQDACGSANCVALAPCASGYVRAGSECLDVNECTVPGPCTAPNQECRNLPGTYQCLCRTPPNLLLDPGFELQLGTAPVSPWTSGPPWDLDQLNQTVSTGKARTGAKSVQISSQTGWSEISQRVAVKPGTTYRLTAFFAADANVPEAWIGARQPNVDKSETGAVMLTFDTPASYREVSSVFESGSWYEVDVYFGLNMGSASPSSVELDDVKLAEVSPDGSCI